jgi:hypothetical protein
MTQRTLRRTAAALAAATMLAVAAPAHAGGWRTGTAGSGWMESVLQWVARVWVWQGRETERGLKAGHGIDPNGGTPPPPPDSDDGRQAIDPNG